MENKENSTGLALFCNEKGIIERILFSDFDNCSESDLLHKTFITLATSDSIDHAIQFLAAVNQFGHASGWSIQLNCVDKTYSLSFMGALVNNGMLLVGYVLPMSANQLHVNQEVEIVQQKKQQEQDLPLFNMDSNELLDELSRVNNELINVKRELTRKNILLERMLKNK